MDSRVAGIKTGLSATAGDETAAAGDETATPRDETATPRDETATQRVETSALRDETAAAGDETAARAGQTAGRAHLVKVNMVPIFVPFQGFGGLGTGICRTIKINVLAGEPAKCRVAKQAKRWVQSSRAGHQRILRAVGY